VVRAGDTAGLARALGALLIDPAGAARMGEAGRAAALAAYSHDRWIEAYLDVYAAAAGGRG
jgi:glycosyltransferase involved in cell wall biosynthesis